MNALDGQKIFAELRNSKYNARVGGNDPALVARHQCAVLRRAGMLQHDRILDFGCGIGRTMAEIHLTHPSQLLQLDGCDISEDLIQEARRIFQPFCSSDFFTIRGSNPHYDDLGTGNESKPPPKVYQFLYSFSVFTHLDLSGARDALSMAHQFLQPGGTYLFTLFRLDDSSRIIIDSSSSPSFKFTKPTIKGAAEYFALDQDKYAFAALEKHAIEGLLSSIGFEILAFHDGGWRGIPSDNIHDDYLIRKL